MTPAQQSALEALVGRPLDAGELALAWARLDGALADSLSAGRTAVGSYWLTDRGLVTDLTAATGNTAMSDSILAKLDGAAAASRSVQAVTNRLYHDARGVDFGNGDLRTWITASTPALFTEAERDALLALAVQPAPLSTDAVSAILNGA